MPVYLRYSICHLVWMFSASCDNVLILLCIDTVMFFLLAVVAKVVFILWFVVIDLIILDVGG